MSTSTSINSGTVYQLYLGKHIGIFDRMVSEIDFNRFITDEVLGDFESFSVTDGIGYWKGKPEPIKVLTIISYSYEDALIIHRIADSYKKRFYQDAVLVNTHSCFPNLV
jgi:hypothetical protein